MILICTINFNLYLSEHKEDYPEHENLDGIALSKKKENKGDEEKEGKASKKYKKDAQ